MKPHIVKQLKRCKLVSEESDKHIVIKNTKYSRKYILAIPDIKNESTCIINAIANYLKIYMNNFTVAKTVVKDYIGYVIRSYNPNKVSINNILNIIKKHGVLFENDYNPKLEIDDIEHIIVAKKHSIKDYGYIEKTDKESYFNQIKSILNIDIPVLTVVYATDEMFTIKDNQTIPNITKSNLLYPLIIIGYDNNIIKCLNTLNGIDTTFYINMDDLYDIIKDTFVVTDFENIKLKSLLSNTQLKKKPIKTIEEIPTTKTIKEKPEPDGNNVEDNISPDVIDIFIPNNTNIIHNCAIPMLTSSIISIIITIMAIYLILI